MGFLRAFFFAPSNHVHAQDVEAIRGLLPRLSAVEVVEGAYRRSGGRQASFFFAQGILIGAMGNLFASSLGHFIDRGAGAWGLPDTAWAGVGLLSLGAMATMTWGAVRRYRQNAHVEALFLQELRQRGGAASDDSQDPDDLVARSPPRRRR
ncbi:MAG: hypothetical protein QOI63_1289 [Thermoplasmata archaeon]|nr:hypothetical protein [Thermoplasmata archaeon]